MYNYSMWLGVLAVILSGAVGGAINSVAVKVGGREFTPILFTVIRFFLSTVIILPFFALQKSGKFYSSDRKTLLFMSVLFGFNIVLFSVGTQFTSAIMAQLLYVISPVLVVIFAHFMIGEKYTKEKGIGLFIALVGVGFLLYQSASKQSVLTFGTPLGNILVLLGVIFTSLYYVLSKRLSHSYSSTTITFMNFLVTMILVTIMFPFQYFLLPHNTIHINQAGIVSVVAIVFSSVVAYLLLYISIKRTNAFIGSLNLYISPFFTALTAIIVIGEKLTITLIISGLLILGGVLYATAFHQVKRFFSPSSLTPEN